MSASVIFRSKISVWFTISVVLPLGFAVVMAFLDPWYVSLTMLPVLILSVPIYFRTFYKIQNINQLNVVCGLFYNKTFSIDDIVSLRPSSNVMSSPALSLDRLEIRFRDKKTVLISPVKPDQFTALLCSINPAIEVRKK